MMIRPESYAFFLGGCRIDQWCLVKIPDIIGPLYTRDSHRGNMKLDREVQKRRRRATSTSIPRRVSETCRISTPNDEMLGLDVNVRDRSRF